MRRLVSGIALGGCLLLAACEFSGPLGSIGTLTPLVAVDSFRTVVSGVVLDAATGNPIVSPAEISFSGEAGHLVRDLFGGSVEGWTSSEGFASYGIANSVHPRPDRPVGLRVIARAAGYRANSTRIEMRRDGRHEFRIVLVASDLRSDTVSGSGEFRIRSDSTVEQVVVIARSLGRDVLSVRIPPNTAVASGTEDTLEGTHVIQASWQPPSARSLSQFPGGLDAGVRLRDGPDIQATQTTGAVMSITALGITSPVFGDSLEVTSIVSPALKSPRTNAPILPGDLVDVLRWMPEEGIWLEHTQTKVQRVGGEMAATFRSATTGTFSVGFFNFHCSDARVRLSGNTHGGSIVAWHGSPGQADAQRLWRFGPGQRDVVLESPPGFWEGTLEVRHNGDVTSVSYSSLCAAQLDIALQGSSVPDLIEVDASPLGCSSFAVANVPTLSILSIPRASPLSGEGALFRPPYLVDRLEQRQTSPGRLASFSFGPVGAEGTLFLILGGRHWRYETAQNGVLDISNMARESGLCT